MKFLPLACLGVLASAGAAQQLLAPVDMVWRASSETTNSSTTSVLMRTTLFHSQLMYDKAHFLNQGVTGPIVINRLRFRVEDSEPNAGGHVYTNLTVRLSDTAAGIDTATMSSTFANNLGPNVGTAEVLPTVTLLPASGGVPNDYALDLPLTSGAFVYDPTTMGHLLIDVDSPNAPTPTTGLPPFACASSQATHLARAVYTTTAASATGTLTASVPVCLFDFSGAGGYPALLPAQTGSLGVGCGGSADSFYQWFATGEPFDLAGTSLMLTPDNVALPTRYTVTAGTTPVDTNQLITLGSTADDAVVTQALGFTFHFPGGSTATIKPCTNGFCWLDGVTTTTDLSPTVAELLGGGTSAYPARVALYWRDLHAGRNTTTSPGSGLYTAVDTSGGPGNTVAYATWHQIGQYNQVSVGGNSLLSFQLVLYEATGQIELRYGTMIGGLGAGTCLTGFTPGTRGSGVNSTDPGSRDLSVELPFTTNGPDGLPGMTLAAANSTVTGSTRLLVNTPFVLTASNIPAVDDLGLFLSDFGVTAGLPLPFLATGCTYNLPLPSLYAIAPMPVGTATTAPLTVPAPCIGYHIYFQFFSANLMNGLVDLHSSNVVSAVAGLR